MNPSPRTGAGTAGRRPKLRGLTGLLAASALLVTGCTSTSASSGAATTANDGAASGTAQASRTAPAGGTMPAGGTGRAVSSTTPATPTTPLLRADSPVPRSTANDLAANSAHRLLPIDGEVFRLKVDYWTTVDSTTWDATGAKNIHLLAYLQPAAGGKAPDVVLDRFSPAFTLVAGQTSLTGVAAGNTIDPDTGGVAGDSFGANVGGGLPGFLLTSKVSYGAQFAVAGVSGALADRWQLLAPGQVLSEAALQRAGVYAVRASMTYRLLVRNAGDAGWHRRTVTDTVTVPVKARS